MPARRIIDGWKQQLTVGLDPDTMIRLNRVAETENIAPGTLALPEKRVDSRRAKHDNRPPASWWKH